MLEIHVEDIFFPNNLYSSSILEFDIGISRLDVKNVAK